MVHLVYCESDPDQKSYLALLIQEYHAPESIKATGFINVGAMLRYLDRFGHYIDIVICNVVVGEFNGIRLMRLMQERLPNVQVIFVSKYADMVFDAYVVRHIAFIPVPINISMFHRALTMAIENVRLMMNRPCLTLARQGLISRIDLDDILYIESNLRNVLVHTCRNMQCFPRQLESIKPLLDFRFVQCHKSFLVNMEYIQEFNSEQLCIRLRTGHQVPVSNRRLKDIKKAFLNFVAEQIDDSHTDEYLSNPQTGDRF